MVDDRRSTADRYGGYYTVATGEAVRELERVAVGADWGGNGHTTVAQSHELVDALRLGPGSRLADLGSGAGWPGLYLAHLSGCDVVLSDLTPAGMGAARKRAIERGVDRALFVTASATDVPLADASFDAVSHSDLLC